MAELRHTLNIAWPLRTGWVLLAAAVLPQVARSQETRAEDHTCRAPALNSAEFERLHRLIRRQPGEQRYLEIDWVLDPWEARKKAAAEGKPILVFSHVGDALGHI